MGGLSGMCGGGECGVLVGKPEGKGPLGRLGMDGRIMLKCFFKAWTWTGLTWLGMGTSDRPFDDSGERSSSIKCREFPGLVRNDFLFKKDSSAWS